MKSLVGILAFSCLMFSVHAEIYRSTDAAGNVIYSDQPREGAEPVKLPGLTSFQSPSIPASSSVQADDNQDQPVESKYETFEFGTPANDATIRDNNGRVDVSLNLVPRLDRGDSVVYELDGQKFTVKGQSHAFTDVDRGTHTLKAYIVDTDGNKVTADATITFHMKRASKLIKPAQ